MVCFFSLLDSESGARLHAIIGCKMSDLRPGEFILQTRLYLPLKDPCAHVFLPVN